MIKVIYNKVCGRCVQSEPLTSGMVGQTIHFEYSHDFDGLTLTAVFTNGKTTVDVLNPGNQCVIPHEVLDTVGEVVKVGVYAVRGNELVIPTIYANIGTVLNGADPSGDVSADPTLPVWAQTQALIGNLNELTTEAKNNLVAAINEAAQSGGGSTVELDTTLTQSGKAADAKAVGDALAEQAKQIAGNKTAIEKIQESMVCGIGISKIMRITQSEYDALETKDETTLYIIADGASGGNPVDPDAGMIPYLHITAPCDIDTGILQTVDTAVEITVYDTDLKNNNGYLGGQRYYIYGQNAPWLGACFSNVTFSVKVTDFTTTGVKNTYRLDNTGLYINGTLAQAASSTPTDPGWTTPAAEKIRLRLFCMQSGSYPDSLTLDRWLNDAKFYGAKIWQAGELVRDMIPAEDSNGVACVYDKVTQTYLYKTETNTGTLTYGKEANE